MERAKFLRSWDHLPDLKCAELIDGVVYVASPVSITDASWDSLANLWLALYAGETPGTITGTNATWLMLESAPQPDVHLCILPKAGGQAEMTGTYFAGAPELAIEVSLTSTEIDFGPKMALYARAGVREYINPAAFWARDSREIRMAIERGCAAPTHAAFVKRLARRRH